MSKPTANTWLSRKISEIESTPEGKAALDAERVEILSGELDAALKEIARLTAAVNAFEPLVEAAREVLANLNTIDGGCCLASFCHLEAALELARKEADRG